jgi:NADH-quinone oxidoreductase subunit E
MTFSADLEAKFAKLLRSYPEGRERAALIPMLLFAQDETGALTKEVIEEIAGRVRISVLDVDEVISYYTMLTRKPRGRHHVQICTNVSCLLLGADQLFDQAREKLGIDNHGVTPDGELSLEEVECLGACSWGPAMQVNYDYQHFVTPEKLDKLIADLRKTQ